MIHNISISIDGKLTVLSIADAIKVRDMLNAILEEISQGIMIEDIEEGIEEAVLPLLEV